MVEKKKFKKQPPPKTAGSPECLIESTLKADSLFNPLDGKSSVDWPFLDMLNAPRVLFDPKALLAKEGEEH